MEYLRRAWAEISLDAISENLNTYKKYLTEKTELLCVVKASCYGHCDTAVVPYLEKLGVKWFAVSNEVEACHLRKCGVNGEILILGYTPPEAADILVENNIIQAVTEYTYAEKLSASCHNGRLRCHVAVDTGMTRIGLRGNTLQMADDIEKIMRLENICVEGLFTHYAVADSDVEEDSAYTDKQTKIILDVDDELKKRGINLAQTHFLNSAGGIYHYNDRSTLARLGIILYGLMPNTAKPLPFHIFPAMSLKAAVAQVKTIEAGESVSYGRTYTAEKTTKLATVTIGYADGYPRLLSNKAEVLIHGKRAKITGRICMDQFMCDVTNIDNVCEGDTVTLIGRDGDDEITADQLADSIGTIGYELICGISARVPRIIMDKNNQIDIFEEQFI